jgi:hypothetical protein
VTREGLVHLDKLYAFGREVDLFRRDKKKEVFEKYQILYRSLIKAVDNTPGWYIWFRESPGEKKIIYIGASFVSLYERLEKELRDEYIIFWMKEAGNKEPEKDLSRLYDGKYNAQISRSGKKFGANRILWIGIDKDEITEGELDVVEMKLINKFQYTHKLANKIKRDYSKIELPLFNEIEKKVDSNLGA